MAFSFKKKASGKPAYPRGTKPSFNNSCLHVSSGVPSLDVLLGGGLAVGSAILIAEDAHNSYASLLLQYFLAEGVVCGHQGLLCSSRQDPSVMLQTLPAPANEPKASSQAPPTDQGNMKIAWRYQNKPEVKFSFSQGFGHFYDLSTHMDRERVEGAGLVCYPPHWTGGALSYDDLIQALQDKVHQGGYCVEQPCIGQRSVLRVVVQSVATPLWNEGDLSPAVSLAVFLHRLRAVLRKSYAVAMVTAPMSLLQELCCEDDVERLSDCLLELEAFEGSDQESNPMYREYQGLLHCHKLPRVNTLQPLLPDTLDLAFKLKRKMFSIEKLHLPPDLSETVSREPSKTEKANLKRNIDF